MIEPYAPVAGVEEEEEEEDDELAGEGEEEEGEEEEGEEEDEVAGVEEVAAAVFAAGNVLGVVLFEDEVELSNPSIIPLPNPPYLKYPAALTSNTTTKINIVVILSKCIFLFY